MLVPRSAHIVGVASQTPVGLVAESTAAAIRAGIKRIGEHPFLVAADGEHVHCGRVPSVDVSVTGAPRLLELARPLFGQLASKVPRVEGLNVEIPCLLGLPEIRPGFSAADSSGVTEAISRTAALGAAQIRVRAEVDGHAGPLRGLATALELLADGRCDLCMVAAVDSYLDGATIDWLESALRLAHGDVRGGFPPGEGGAMLLLANENALRRFGLPSLAILRSAAWTHETGPQEAPEGPLGKALAAAYEEALRAVRGAQRVDDIYCDINDERTRTTDYGFASLRMGNAFRAASEYLSPVGKTGDLGAVTPLLNCILAARAWSRAYASGPLALVSGSSWGGLRGAALLQKAGG